MRFVPVKTAEQQAALMMVGVRDRLIQQSHAAVERHSRLCGRFWALPPPRVRAHLVPLLERHPSRREPADRSS